MARQRVVVRLVVCAAAACGGALVAGPVSAGGGPSPTPPPGPVSLPALPYDFNGDGYPELLIGHVGQLGGFWVMRGSASGPSTTTATHWTRDSPGITGSGQGMDTAFASGDFDRDGYADVAASRQLEPAPLGALAAGNVQVLYGSASGLTADRSQWWTQNTPGIADTAESSDQFGRSLAVGDLNGDGYDDLAIGVPEEDVGPSGSIEAAGAVHVLFGSPTGLTASASQFWNADSGGVPGVAAARANFGERIVVADVTSDGFDDLVLGLPYEQVGALVDAGAVLVLPGSANGPTAQGAQQWTAALSGLTNHEELYFGGALAAGDFGGTSDLELAIGITGRKVTPISVSPEGSLVVLTGTPAGLTATGRQLWTQSSPGIADDPEPFDVFGYRLAAGDVNGDGHDDLAVGANDEAGPWPTDESNDRRGVVHVLFGSTAGLTGTGSQFWHQDAPNVAGTAHEEEFFGSRVQILDWDRDGYADLAMGSTNDYVGPMSDQKTYQAGSTNLLFGTILGPTTARQQYWHQGAYAIPGPYGPDYLFGILGT